MSHGQHSHDDLPGHRAGPPGQRTGREYYLEDLPLDEARARFAEALRQAGAESPLPGERVPLNEALGRVTASPVWAKHSSPHYHAAAMDGAAVRASDTLGATETSPLRLQLGTQAVWVNTGDAMPQGFDAVVMREVIYQPEQATIEIMEPVAPWQHVRPMGEDIVARELVLPENSLLRPQDLGAIAGCGHADVTVRRRPLVGIIPTGSELVPPGHDVSPGDIIEYNSLMLAAQVQEWGGEPVCGNIVRDDMEQLIDAVGQAVQRCDVVVINAGSSAGTEDYTAEVVRRLGALTVHGVAIRPGHPVVLGIVDHTPVLGIPGYPASALITSELFLQPLVRSLLGLASSSGQVVEATMTRKVLSPMGEDEYLRVKLGKVGNRLIAAPLQRGAGVIMSLVRADGLALIPRFSEGVDAGATISVILRRPLDRIEDTIVAIGSHDVTLDLLASHLARRRSDRSLSSSNVGSLGGLVALRRGEAHLAGTHLLDEATGEYNVPFVRKQLGRTHPGNGSDGGDNGWVVMTLVHREQGIIVAKGNPKRIDSLADLAREGVVFVNRQRGSGTRVLLDYQLQSLGLAPERIQGYDREQFTHLAVAADVASGTADAALGILAAARALDLDFIPLLKERYDLVMSREVYRSDLMAPLFEILHDDAFRTEVEALGGYDVSHMGNIVTEIS